MGSDVTEAKPPARKRSRSGCYTCKFRKVRCEAIAESRKHGQEKPSKCDNCHRLGFQCRWSPPSSGEKYNPPPKRRRAARGKRDETSDMETVGSNILSNRSSGVAADKQIDSTELTSHQDQRNLELDTESKVTDDRGPNHYQTEFLDALATDLDISAGYDIFDLSFVGEGLDFVPLPNIEPKSQADADADADADAVPSSSRLEWLDMIQIPDLSLPPSNSMRSNDDASIHAQSQSSPSVNEGDRRLIQHYLDVMKGFAKVEDYSRDANNLFITAFSESLCFPPLFYAILCFSASHLGMENQAYLDQARRYDQLAEESFDAVARGTGAAQMDGLLSALFVRVKTIHITGGSVDVFLDFMKKAAEIITSMLGANQAEELSSLTKRIIIRLAILDARAAYYRLGGGELVNSLRDIPALAFIFDGSVETENSHRAMIDLLRGTILRMRVAELDVRLHEQLTAEVVSVWPLKTEAFTSLYAEIRREIDKWEQKAGQCVRKLSSDCIFQDEVVDPASFDYHIVLCALHSALLYLYVVYPMPFVDYEASVSKILETQLKLRRDPSRLHSPSSILPSSLFLAGLCTADPIRQDWVLQLFKSCEQSSTYIRKSRELLQGIFKLRSTKGPMDVCSFMDQTTGRFII